MTHEEYERAITYWKNKKTTPMPREKLLKKADEYIEKNNTCALATGTGDFIRCTPVEYSYHDGKFWIFTEGGEKFIGLEKNKNVSLAIYDKYDGFGNLNSIQVTGIATFITPFTETFNNHAAYKKISIEALKRLNAPMNLLCITPTKMDLLFSDFKKEGYSNRQTLLF